MDNIKKTFLIIFTSFFMSFPSQAFNIKTHFSKNKFKYIALLVNIVAQKVADKLDQEENSDTKKIKRTDIAFLVRIGALVQPLTLIKEEIPALLHKKINTWDGKLFLTRVICIVLATLHHVNFLTADVSTEAKFCLWFFTRVLGIEITADVISTLVKDYLKK